MPAGDVFDRAGINKLRPDGTKKTPAELNEELSIYYMKKKKAQNPSYGTVGNIEPSSSITTTFTSAEG